MSATNKKQRQRNRGALQIVTSDQAAIGARIRARRHELGLKAGLVAVRSGLTPNHYYVLERSESSPVEATIKRIARVLRCEPEYLLTGEPVPEASKQVAR